ncbi:MAG: amidohydrolase [Ignavibacteria bacterium]|nr:amidohydrolase [Ignavibacteria bacterium]
MNIQNKIKSLAKFYSKELVILRRQIHQNPELSFNEFETTRLLFTKLKNKKIANVKRITQTGLYAVINGKQKGKCLALRADIDALPIQENTGLSFASKNTGIMHACGHDSHSAMVYGAALILNDLKDQISGSVKFIFQPAEEKNPGGASILIKNGILKNPKVDVIFGQHILPGKPAGKVGFYPGVMMASQDEIYITIKGKAGHGAKPQSAIDPIVIASQLILALQTIVSRYTNPYEPTVITIGKISGGTINNVIPEKVNLAGTVRTLNEKLRKNILKLIERTIKGICLSGGATYDFKISKGYPELINSPKETAFTKQSAIEFLGKENVFAGERFMFAEDFAYYLKKCPGSFYWIGAGNTSGLHTSTLNLDEKLISQGAAFMAYLAWNWLNNN